MPNNTPAELTGEAKVNKKIKERLTEDYTYNSEGQRVNKHEHWRETIANAKKITSQHPDYHKLKVEAAKNIDQDAQAFYDKREVMREKQQEALGRLSKQIKKETPARLKPQEFVGFSSNHDKIYDRIKNSGN